MSSYPRGQIALLRLRDTPLRSARYNIS
jgi:hypothetical protein